MNEILSSNWSGIYLIQSYLGGGFSLHNLFGIFTPNLGEMSQFDVQIFQMG